jgi:hypothetical protein
MTDKPKQQWTRTRQEYVRSHHSTINKAKAAAQALVVIMNDIARADAHLANLKLRNIPTRSTYNSPDAYTVGVRAGEAIQLRGGCELAAGSMQITKGNNDER